MAAGGNPARGGQGRNPPVAKGLTNQPLVYVVADELYEHPEILKRMAAGHRVFRWSSVYTGPPPDLVLHSAAHFFTEDMIDYLPAADTAARRRRRQK